MCAIHLTNLDLKKNTDRQTQLVMASGATEISTLGKDKQRKVPEQEVRNKHKVYYVARYCKL